MSTRHANHLVAVDGNAPPLKASKAPGPTFILNGINQMHVLLSLAVTYKTI